MGITLIIFEVDNLRSLCYHSSYGSCTIKRFTSVTNTVRICGSMIGSHLRDFLKFANKGSSSTFKWSSWGSQILDNSKRQTQIALIQLSIQAVKSFKIEASTVKT
jgi:hypothetical protein